MYFLLKVLKCTKIGRFERKIAIFDGMTEKSDQKLSEKIDLFIVEKSKIHKVEFLVDWYLSIRLVSVLFKSF